MNLVGAGSALGAQWHQWCCDFAFPSTDWDTLVPASGNPPSKNLVRSVAGSPLCHVSRTKWETAYYAMWGETPTVPPAAYNDRCTKLTCDCTKKAVQMLNDWKNGVAIPAWAAPADYAACYTCHKSMGTAQKLKGVTQGKEDCTNCHTEVVDHSVTATTITLATTSTNAMIGSVPTLSGTLTPSGTIGGNVVVYVMKPGRTYWSYSSNRTVYSHGGTPAWLYKYTFKVGMPKGIYKFKAVFPAQGGLLGCTSPNTVSITLR
jgi:hypothetical protein